MDENENETGATEASEGAPSAAVVAEAPPATADAEGGAAGGAVGAGAARAVKRPRKTKRKRGRAARVSRAVPSDSGDDGEGDARPETTDDGAPDDDGAWRAGAVEADEPNERARRAKGEGESATARRERHADLRRRIVEHTPAIARVLSPAAPQLSALLSMAAGADLSMVTVDARYQSASGEPRTVRQTLGEAAVGVLAQLGAAAMPENLAARIEHPLGPAIMTAGAIAAAILLVRFNPGAALAPVDRSEVADAQGSHSAAA